ncbi:MAG: nucleotidyltransferase family protein [bacterium]
MAAIKTFKPSFLEKGILKNFSVIIGREIPEATKIIIFGSRARGGSDEGSDLDVAVIFDMPHISKEVWDKLWNIKWRVLESLDAEEFPFSLSLITKKDLESRDFGLEETIKKDGIVVWKR